MTVSGVTHRMVEASGIHLHVAEQGEGPLVVLCHGFPESWYSWRHQLAALSAAGFHAVAPDMRGYGQSDRPEAIDQYTLLHLVGDMVGLLDALGADQAVIAGHDWGAPVAWHSALLRPDRFRAVIGLSVPHRPRTPVIPTSVMPRTDDAMFYQLYFQTPGVAEAELERDVRETVVRLLYSASGDVPRRAGTGGGDVGMVPRGGGFLTRMLRRGRVADMARRSRFGLLCRRIHADRISRRAQLVSQHRPELGTAGALCGCESDGPGALHGRRPRSGGRVSEHGPGHRQFG
jgi:pimeloyl-ACP methyl ester carboxylesterase